ncbi:MAG: DUF1624 domain-containing protein [Candidatus Micrarchaeota archaeon]|nr:DUF1624 domain-containing protein [Candidatus Micrarchaeota archaeon]
MRIEQLDALRGIGIAAVVLYHIFFDLHFFSLTSIDPNVGLLALLGRGAASLMIIIVGASLVLSYERVKNLPFLELTKKYFTRAAKLFLVALLISLVSYIFYPEGWIIWGIIHFISFAVFFCSFFARFDKINLILAILSIIIGFIIKNIETNNILLFVLGYRYPIYTLDYFSIFPWIGLVFLGMFLGKKIYIEKKFSLAKKELWAQKYFAILGRHSLSIYLLHQIPIIGIILILKQIL